MHANEQLLTRLFDCLNAHDHQGMADCYHEQATFRDIAFSLAGQQQIHAMWEMICSDNDQGKSDIVVEEKEISANDSTGRAVVVDEYTFRDTQRRVVNQINSEFEFRDGKIIKQLDRCDPVSWASQAIGGFRGFIAGHLAFIRRWKAMTKLKAAFPQAF